MTKIAFDIDNTLITKSVTGEDIPNYQVLFLFMMFADFGYDMYVWSGSGVDYAKRWTEKLGISFNSTVVAKGSFIPDIAVDDEVVELGKVNLVVNTK